MEYNLAYTGAVEMTSFMQRQLCMPVTTLLSRWHMWIYELSISEEER